MSAVLPSPSHFSDADFARTMARKFAHGRFLIVGGNSQELERQFAEAKREAFVVSSSGDLTTKLGQGQAATLFETAVWFYSSGENDDARVAEALSNCATNVVLVPGLGADAARRRPGLVRYFTHFGLLPDYEFDVTELDSAAVFLRRQPSEAAGALTPTVEVAFARLNRALSDVKRSLQIRGSEDLWS